MDVFKIQNQFILKFESKVKKIKSEIKLYIDNLNKFEYHICVMVKRTGDFTLIYIVI